MPGGSLSQYSQYWRLTPALPPPPLACLLQVGGKEFTPAGTIAMTKQADFEGGKLFPYLGGPYQGIDEAHLAFR